MAIQQPHDSLNGSAPESIPDTGSELPPSYRFPHDDLPPALAPLRDEPEFVGWRYEQRNGRWTKPPIDPRAGRYASVSNPATWAPFDVALAGMERHGLSGVGLVLTGNGIVGIDLDGCVTDAGSFSPLAAEVLSLGETYAELSPSGEGIRLFARGSIEAAIKDDKAGIEIYDRDRYLTITGDQVPGTPSEIRSAPKTLAALMAAAQAGKTSPSRKLNGKAQPSGGDFYAKVNATALHHLDRWVLDLHPTARRQPNGAYRISSKALARDLEEDLAYHPEGIRDHGEEHGLTPIDAVMRYGDAKGATAAAFWLCQRMGVEPVSIGWNGEETEDRPRQGKRDGKRTQAERLIEIATGDNVDLYHAPDGTAYADIRVNRHRETWSLKSASFRRLLRRRYYEETEGAPNGEAMAAAMGVIEARAMFDGPVRSVHLRVAGHGDRIYLDLCDPLWRAIEIDADGWRIVDRPPVRFRRTPGMLSIPDPVRGGTLDELRRHLHVDDTGYVLAVSWVLATLRGRGPYPILALTGEQGTGKSWVADMLRRLLDPHAAPLRSLPRDTRDLYVAAINGHVLVFDNLSGVPTEISDALCRLSTGGGFSTRALYTDGDEILFDGQRPIALTSITDVASRSDLADRLVIVRLDVIPDEERRPEAELRAAFEAARPRILGALLDAVSHGLMQLPHTRLDRYPRMADYALWVRACETAIWRAGMHMAAYEANRADAVDVVLDADPVATTLRRHMEGRAEWTGTATDLLGALTALVGEHVRRSRHWPASARGLSGQLTRLAPALRRIGVSIEHSRQGRAGVRLLHITREINA